MMRISLVKSASSNNEAPGRGTVSAKTFTNCIRNYYIRCTRFIELTLRCPSEILTMFCDTFKVKCPVSGAKICSVSPEADDMNLATSIAFILV